MRYLYVFLFSLTLTSALAQTTGREWIYDLAGGGRTESAHSLLYDSTEQQLLIAAQSRCGDTLYNCLELVALDRQGAVRWQRTISRPRAIVHPGPLVRMPDGSYLVGGGEEDFAAGTHRAWLQRISPQGDTVWHRFYNDSVLVRLNKLLLQKENTIIAWAAGEGNYYTRTSELLKFNEQGELLQHLFPVDTIYQDFLFDKLQIIGDHLSPINDTTFIATREIPLKYLRNESRQEAGIYRSDSLSRGWRTRIDVGDPAFNQHLGMYHIDSLRYYEVGYTEIVNWRRPFDSTLLGLEKTLPIIQIRHVDYYSDPNFYAFRDVIGDTTYLDFPGHDAYRIRDALVAPNGDLIGAGYTTDTLGRRRGWVFRVSPEAELLWSRTYQSALPHVFTAGFEKLAYTEDDRLLLLGTLTQAPDPAQPWLIDRQTWVVELDSSGCYEPGCDDGHVLLDDDDLPPVVRRGEYFRAYPNPTAAILTLDWQESPPQGHRLLLFDATGRMLAQLTEQPEQMDLSSYPPGLYFLRLDGPDGVYQVHRVVRR